MTKEEDMIARVIHRMFDAINGYPPDFEVRAELFGPASQSCRVSIHHKNHVRPIYEYVVHQ